MGWRYFTLDEARAALPQVARLVGQVLAARRDLIALQPEIWPVLERAVQNGGAPAALRMLRQVQALEAAVRELRAMGVLLKDLDQGLVDFPSLRDGREVFLCWKHEEDDILWWHEVDAGFAGRQPV